MSNFVSPPLPPFKYPTHMHTSFRLPLDFTISVMVQILTISFLCKSFVGIGHWQVASYPNRAGSHRHSVFFSKYYDACMLFLALLDRVIPIFSRTSLEIIDTQTYIHVCVSVLCILWCWYNNIIQRQTCNIFCLCFTFYIQKFDTILLCTFQWFVYRYLLFKPDR